MEQKSSSKRTSGSDGGRHGCGRADKRKLELEFNNPAVLQAGAAASALKKEPKTPVAATPLTEEQLTAAENCIAERCRGCAGCQSESWVEAAEIARLVAASLHVARKAAAELQVTLKTATQHRDGLCAHNFYPTLLGSREVKCSACGIQDLR